MLKNYIPKHLKICPICKKEARVQRYYEEVGPVEESIYCPNCGYSYEFAYGNYIEIIGNEAFIWDYTLYNDWNLLVRFFKKSARKTFMTRRNYKKFHRKSTSVKYVTFGDIKKITKELNNNV